MMTEALVRFVTLTLFSTSLAARYISILTVVAIFAVTVHAFSRSTGVASKVLHGDSGRLDEVPLVRKESLETEDGTVDTEYTATPEDLELMKQADEAAAVEQYLVAGRLLRRVSNEAVLKAKHKLYLVMALQSEQIMEDLMSPYPEESGWTKQCESHGRRDTLIYYKVDERFRLTCRIETPIEVSMLVPLLAVMNETDLFHAAGESVMVKELGRGNQIVHVIFDTPFPFENREMYQYGFAVDEIDNNESIIVKIHSLDPGEYDGVIIPEPTGRGLVRVDYDAGVLIRSCPPDHPTLVNSQSDYPTGEKLLLLSLTQCIDPHVHYVPKRLVNYVTRSVMGHVWGNLLATTEEVRDGKRPAHQEAINNNRELYGWVEQRVKVMLAKMEHKDRLEQGGTIKADDAMKKSTKVFRYRYLFACCQKSKKKKSITTEPATIKMKTTRRRLET